MADTDEEYYRDQHFQTFGHYPVPDLSGRQKCIHHIHDEVRRLIDGAGVDIFFEFEPGEILSEDGPEMERVKGQYEAMKAGYRDMIQRVADMEDFMARRGTKKWY